MPLTEYPMNDRNIISLIEKESSSRDETEEAILLTEFVNDLTPNEEIFDLAEKEAIPPADEKPIMPTEFADDLTLTDEEIIDLTRKRNYSIGK